MRIVWVSLSCALMMCVSPLTAGDEGDSFLGGQVACQRLFQKPKLQTGIGRVEFAVTCRSKLAQLYFNQGLLMLYHHEDGEADRAFRQAALIDPDCAVAHWGLAMANRRVPDAAAPHIQKARALSEEQRVSDREQFLIKRFAIDWEGGQSTYQGQGPQDAAGSASGSLAHAEVKALMLWRLLQAADEADVEFDWAFAKSLLRSVLRENPQHPVQIEWLARCRSDSPEQLLAAAAHACEVMPCAPKVWREAGRANARAERYEAAVQCYTTALRLEHARMHDDWILPEQVPGHAETVDGLIDSLARLGRVHDALQLACEMVATPSLTPDAGSGRSQAICLQAQRRLLELLSRYELWTETIELSQMPVWNSFCPGLEGDQITALGAAYFFSGDVARGREQMARLKTQWLKTVLRQKQTAATHAPRGSRTVQELVIERLASAESDIERIESAMHILRLYEAFATRNWPLLRELLDRNSDVPEAQLARLQQTVNSAGIPAAVATATDAKARAPEPFTCSHWQPFTAPALTLPDRHGKLVSLDNYRGKPVLIVCYLGVGCPHCIRQLQELASVHADFAKAGIAVIAVSSDTIEGLEETYRLADQNPQGDSLLPLLLVSDSLTACFRSYRAFDEFRDAPLHGVFLLDGERRVLWRSTGPEPWMEFGFLLEEAKRLLRGSAGQPASAHDAQRAAD